ncbi:hypothetical protein J6590_099652 [Homalodisca vitripennis]|nr:hypothetical protein J6590_099652 [Homalodisca vitripennis]
MLELCLSFEPTIAHYRREHAPCRSLKISMSGRTSRTQEKKEDPRPYIKDLVRVKAIRGEKTLVYEVDMKEAVEWKVLDFLNKKVKTKGVPFPSPVQICRGISVKRNDGILEKLVIGKNSIVSENRLEFWNSLPTTTDNDGGLDNEN